MIHVKTQKIQQDTTQKERKPYLSNFLPLFFEFSGSGFDFVIQITADQGQVRLFPRDAFRHDCSSSLLFTNRYLGVSCENKVDLDL